ncbi:putative defense protein 3 [Panulirus ornatus]|uniref:putative defense protein 3 n=1 Tax=Panulirus ornatus TaxID=150431 RepID=UPI003A8B3A5E
MAVIWAMVATVVYLAATAAGRSDHVPTDACKSMFPSGHGVDAQLSEPPYVFTLPAKMAPNSEVIVILSGSGSSDTFKGFFVKAFNDATSSPIGSFKAPKTIDCDGPASGAHHANSTSKESVTLTWLPPLNFVGSVTFMATVVESRENFWTGVVSDQLILG